MSQLWKIEQNDLQQDERRQVRSPRQDRGAYEQQDQSRQARSPNQSRGPYPPQDQRRQVRSPNKDNGAYPQQDSHRQPPSANQGNGSYSQTPPHGSNGQRRMPRGDGRREKPERRPPTPIKQLSSASSRGPLSSASTESINPVSLASRSSQASIGRKENFLLNDALFLKIFAITIRYLAQRPRRSKSIMLFCFISIK